MGNKLTKKRRFRAKEKTDYDDWGYKFYRDMLRTCVAKMKRHLRVSNNNNKNKNKNKSKNQNNNSRYC